MDNTNQTQELLRQAQEQMAQDMQSREISAIIWDVAEAGFHYIPEIVTGESDGKPASVRITGLYNYQGTLYAIEEDTPGTEMENYYREGVDIPPVVVTLTPDKANDIFGDPTSKKGFTTTGTLEEWVAIADCYFEALAED